MLFTVSTGLLLPKAHIQVKTKNAVYKYVKQYGANYILSSSWGVSLRRFFIKFSALWCHFLGFLHNLRVLALQTYADAARSAFFY